MNGQGEYNVDIVMCIDATGSMAPIINEVKNNAMSFHQKFAMAMEDADKSVDMLRVKVIVFKDYICDSDPMRESKFFELPAESAAFRDFVTSIEPMGGGDAPENALEAIALALKSDWTTMYGKKRHAILVFTDAPALAFGERTDCPGYPAGMPKTLGELGAWWEGTDQEFDSTYKPSAGRLVVFAPNAEPWTELAAWNRYWHAPSKGDGGLDDINMSMVIDLLVGSIG